MAYFVIVMAQYIVYATLPSWGMILAKAAIVVIITYFINDLIIKNDETFANVFFVSGISFLAYDFITLQFNLITMTQFLKSSLPFAMAFGVTTSSLYAMIMRRI